MSDREPIYTPANCHAAYQLNWAVALFPIQPLPPEASWFEELRQATEKDGVRILDHRTAAASIQFLASTRPPASPAEIVRSLKGRLQYAVRRQIPKAFRRNYRIESVGSAPREIIEAYVSKQVDRHPMADPRVQDMMETIQIYDPGIDLSRIRYSAHGQFIHNLHVVLEHEGGWREIDATRLRAVREMIVKVCEKRGLLLSRAGIVADHLHLTLGCGIDHAPETVALCLLNNLAFVQGMLRVYKFSFYAGTFGNYDLGAIRHADNPSE